MDFFQLFNCKPASDTCEIFPEQYSYNSSNVHPRTLSISLSHSLFFPVNSKMGLFVSHSIDILIGFPEPDNLVQFWILFHLCKLENQQHVINPPIPSYGFSQIVLDFPTLQSNSFIQASVFVKSISWDVLIPIPKFFNSISKIQTTLNMCSITETVLPNIPYLLAQTSVESGSDKISTADLSISLQQFLPKMSDYPTSVAFSYLLDMVFSPYEKLSNWILKKFGIANFVKGFELNSLELLQIQLEHFHNVNEFKYHKLPLLPFVSAFFDSIPCTLR